MNSYRNTLQNSDNIIYILMLEGHNGNEKFKHIVTYMYMYVHSNKFCTIRKITNNMKNRHPPCHHGYYKCIVNSYIKDIMIII